MCIFHLISISSFSFRSFTNESTHICSWNLVWYAMPPRLLFFVFFFPLIFLDCLADCMQMVRTGLLETVGPRCLVFHRILLTSMWTLILSLTELSVQLTLSVVISLERLMQIPICKLFIPSSYWLIWKEYFLYY